MLKSGYFYRVKLKTIIIIIIKYQIYIALISNKCSEALYYIKHNIQTFHKNDISNNNETITLWSPKNNKPELVISLIKLL